MKQHSLFPNLREKPKSSRASSSTFSQNMKLPVHRWFRFSAGFSAAWAEQEIDKYGESCRVFDPFAGSGTTLIAAQAAGVEAMGVEAHPFVARVAKAKLNCQSDPDHFISLASTVLNESNNGSGSLSEYPDLVHRCYPDETLKQLDSLRRSIEFHQQDSPEWHLVWLALVSILRACSPSGTAQWQYVLPNKSKKRIAQPFQAFESAVEMMASDMRYAREYFTGQASLLVADARDCEGVPDDYANLVLTSPPYANNYDYADATRLEMCFLQEISGWSDLKQAVRRHLIRSCSQHETPKTIDIDNVLDNVLLAPIADEIKSVCEQLATVRLTKGGKKNYHIMIACYFLDLSKVWMSLRRCCEDGSRVCFVVGDSAPYGVYVPVIDWLGRLAEAAGFKSWTFDKTRDRNIKWKNRKHRVPLCEGRLWVEG
ncbi:MAG: DNA methyltransferase [Phycisphaerales bacterium JB063]